MSSEEERGRRKAKLTLDHSFREYRDLGWQERKRLMDQMKRARKDVKESRRKTG